MRSLRPAQVKCAKPASAGRTHPDGRRFPHVFRRQTQHNPLHVGKRLALITNVQTGSQRPIRAPTGAGQDTGKIPNSEA
eukprot:5296328-Pyramimonas_sp.AAC.1